MSVFHSMTSTDDPRLISLLKGEPVELVRPPRRRPQWGEWIAALIGWLLLAAMGALLGVWIGVGGP